MGDAAAAGEEVEGELAGRLAEIETDVLEPLQAGAGGALGGGDDRLALLLVRRQRPLHGGLFLQTGGEGERVLHGELGAGADGEVRGVGGVAEQHDVLVRPVCVDDRAEGGPGGLVGVQGASAQGVREDLGAALDGVGDVQVREAGGAPDLLAHLDDDGGGVGRVGVAVQLHHAVLGLGDLEAEGVEGEVGGQPDVAAVVGGHMGAEHMGVGLAGGAVHTVGADDQVVGLGQPGGVRGFGVEAEVHAEGAAAVVQDLQETLAPQGREAVSSGGVAGVAVADVYVVPAGEVVLQGLVDLGVRVFYAAEGLVGEDHSEAEGVVGGVAFPDGDLPGGVQAFQQRGGVQPSRSTTHNRHSHGQRPFHFGGRLAVNALWNSE